MVGAEVVLGEGASTRSMIETGRLVGGGRVGRGVVETGSVKLVIVGVVVGGGRCRLCCIVRAGVMGGGGGSGQLHREGEEGVGGWLIG